MLVQLILLTLSLKYGPYAVLSPIGQTLKSAKTNIY